MAKRRKFAAQENAGFGGMDLSGNPQRLAGHIAQFDKNGDHRWPMTWAPRPGLARGALAKLTGIVRNLKWFKARSGVDVVIYTINNYGTMWGTGLPAPDWNPPPALRGGPGPQFANPVTALAVSVPSGLTLTWTNPTQAFWRGTKVLRRTDCYPQGPNDPAATVVYNGRLATCTDAALASGETGYYSAYAYTRTLWAEPAKISGIKAYRVFALGVAALKYSDDNGASWNATTGLPGAGMRYITGTGSALYVTRGNGNDIEVYRSTDGGKTWTARTTIDPGGTTSSHLVPVVLASGRLIIGHESSGTKSGVSYSDDGGGTWTDVNDIANPTDSWAAVAALSTTVFFIAPQAAATTRVHKSTNSGTAFGAELAAESYYCKFLSICSDGTLIMGENGAEVLVGGTTGVTWVSKLTAAVGFTILGMWTYGTTVLVATSDGVAAIKTYVSLDSGATWVLGQTIAGQFLNTGAVQNCVYGYAGGWLLLVNSGKIYGGTSPSALSALAVDPALAADVWVI